jgi:ribosome-associated protein
MNFSKADLQKELSYRTSRSGGKGGQNVNKVATKVELLFAVQRSAVFTDEKKAIILDKLQSRINSDGQLYITSQEERSQLMNKERALNKLIVLLSQALHQPKKRKPAQVSKQAKAKRLEQKRIQAVKKQLRRGDSQAF